MYKYFFSLIFFLLFTKSIFGAFNSDSTFVTIIKGSKVFYYYPHDNTYRADSLKKQDINDFYTNYYRKIYKDSTLINPNYIIPHTNNNSIIFIMDINEFIKNNNMGLDYNDFIPLNNNTFQLKENSINKLNKKLNDNIKK